MKESHEYRLNHNFSKSVHVSVLPHLLWTDIHMYIDVHVTSNSFIVTTCSISSISHQLHVLTTSPTFKDRHSFHASTEIILHCPKNKIEFSSIASFFHQFSQFPRNIWRPPINCPFYIYFLFIYVYKIHFFISLGKAHNSRGLAA